MRPPSQPRVVWDPNWGLRAVQGMAGTKWGTKRINAAWKEWESKREMKREKNGDQILGVLATYRLVHRS